MDTNATLSLTVQAPDAERARHLAMLVQTAASARAEALEAAGTARGRALDEAVAAASRHERERDKCARELGELLAPYIDAGPAGDREARDIP
jgi:hypothetical protein